MKVELYVLGFIKRHTMVHGYELMGLMEQQVADFAQIKTPTIYYQLGRLEKLGFIRGQKEENDKRPDKRVFSLTSSGEEHYRKLLAQVAEFPYQQEYLGDAALFFGTDLDTEQVVAGLRSHLERLETTRARVEAEWTAMAQHIPKQRRARTYLIFSHHLKHFEAEINWAREALNLLEEKEELHED